LSREERIGHAEIRTSEIPTKNLANVIVHTTQVHLSALYIWYKIHSKRIIYS